MDNDVAWGEGIGCPDDPLQKSWLHPCEGSLELYNTEVVWQSLDNKYNHTELLKKTIDEHSKKLIKSYWKQ